MIVKRLIRCCCHKGTEGKSRSVEKDVVVLMAGRNPKLLETCVEVAERPDSVVDEGG